MPQDEMMSMREVIDHVMRVTGCSEHEAIDQIHAKVSEGKLRAFGTNSKTGKREQIPTSYFPHPTKQP